MEATCHHAEGASQPQDPKGQGQKQGDQVWHEEGLA